MAATRSNLRKIPKLYHLYIKKLRAYNLLVISILFLIAAALEAVAISLVSVLVAMLNGNGTRDYSLLNFRGLGEVFDNTTPEKLTLYILVLFIIKFTLKFSVVVFQNYYIFNLGTQLSKTCFSNMLRNRARAIGGHHAGSDLKDLSVEVVQFIGALSALITLFEEVMVILFLSALIISLAEGSSLISLGAILILSLSFDRVIKPYIKKWGEIRERYDSERFTLTKDALGMRKLIYAHGAYKPFIDKFEKLSKFAFNASKNSTISGIAPKVWLEFAATLILIVVVTIEFHNHGSLEAALPILSVFGMALFRLIPSFSRCLNCVQVVRFLKPSFQIIEEHLLEEDLIENTPLVRQDVSNTLKLDNVTVSYGDKTILNDVSVSLKKGKIYGVTGASGEGKTTLINTIIGLIQPRSGEVSVDGKVVNSKNQSCLLRVSYLPQKTELIDGSVYTNVALNFEHSEEDQTRIRESLELSSLNDGFIEGRQNQSIGEDGELLSGGQRQRLGLARAVYQSETLMVMDEPTSALDKVTENKVMKTICSFRKEHIIIIVSHDQDVLDYCDYVLKVDRQKVVMIRKA